jgi:hypothetical protein
MSEDTAEQSNPENEQVVLSHIDKLSQALTRLASSRGRGALFLEVFSILALAVSFGIVSLAEDFSLAGASIKAPLPVFLWGNGIVVAVLMTTLLSLEKRVHVLSEEFSRLYKRLNYEVPWDRPNVTNKNPLDAGDSFEALLRTALTSPKSGLARIYDWMATLTLAVLILGLPFVAEIGIVVKLAQTVGWQRWCSWAPASILSLIIIGAIYDFVKELSNPPGENGESHPGAN